MIAAAAAVTVDRPGPPRRTEDDVAPARPGDADPSAGTGRIGHQVAGRYRLERRLTDDLPGSESWQATDTILARTVRVALLTGPRTGAALDAARRAALVVEPRLARVLDVGRDGPVGHVVSEPVEGRSLADLVAHGPLDPDHARTVVGEAASTLEEARRRGLHHLALRPTSLVVTPVGRVVVVGLALDAALLGLDDVAAHASSRRDAVGLVRVLYAALTARWPALPVQPGAIDAADTPREPDPGLPPAPDGPQGALPPVEVVSTVPADLDTLCAVTLGPHEDGPHSPGELVRELEPWAPVRADSIFRAADAGHWPALPASDDTETGHDTAPTDAPRSGRAAGAAAGTVAGAATAPTAPGAPPTPEPKDPGPAPDAGPAPSPDRSTGDRPAGLTTAPPTGSAPMTDNKPTDDNARQGGDAAPTSGVARQSVRSSFGSEPSAGQRRPGTPPPAPPTPGAFPPVTSQRAGGAGASAAEPAVPPSVPPAASAPPFPEPPGAVRPTSAGGGSGGGGGDRPDWGLPFDGVPAAEPTNRRTRIDPSKWVLGIFGIGLVVALVVAISTVTSPWGGDDDTTAATTPAVTPTAPAVDPSEGSGGSEAEPPADAVAPVVTGITSIDPSDNAGEHEELIGRINDGDPATSWYTHTYNRPDFAGFKDAVGLAITLEQPATVTSVTLQVNGTGGNVEVRATDAANPTSGDILASGPLDSTTVLTLVQPTETQHIVLWFTALAQTADGANRIEIYELTVQ